MWELDAASGEADERAGGVGGLAVQLARTRPSVGSAPSTSSSNQTATSRLAELADNGQLRPTIDQVFPLADARKAPARSLRHNRRGKVVLRVADET